MPTITVGAETIYMTRSEKAATPGVPPLVLIHGAGGTHMHWPAGLRRLSDADVYALDLPGHGKSSGPGRASVDAYRDAVLAWADVMGLERFVPAGHSMGGAVAQSLALAAPERLAGLILVGSGARLRVAPAILDGVRTDYPATAALVSRWCYRDEPSADDLARYVAGLLAIPATVTYNDYAACNAFDVMGQVSRIRAPTLIIVGTEDRMTPPKYSRYLAGEIPRARLVEVERAGHMVALERGDVVSATIREFLDSPDAKIE